MRAGLGVAVFCGTLALSAPALADDVQAARDLFTEGVEAQDAGRFAEAIERYENAAKIAESPRLHFNIATCEEQLNHLLRAADAYRRSLSLARGRGATDVADEAQAKLDALDAEIPRVIVRLPADATDATVLLDGEAIAVDPAGQRVDPGAHHVVVRSKTRESDAQITVDRRTVRVIEVDLGPRSEPPPPVLAPLPPQPSYTPAWIAGGGAAAFGVGAIVTGALGLNVRDRYLTLNAAPTNANHHERDDLRSSGQALFVTNAVLTGLALAAAGLAIYFVVRPPTESSANRHVIVRSASSQR
jgi:hypothetical protein